MRAGQLGQTAGLSRGCVRWTRLASAFDPSTPARGELLQKLRDGTEISRSTGEISARLVVSLRGAELAKPAWIIRPVLIQ